MPTPATPSGPVASTALIPERLRAVEQLPSRRERRGIARPTTEHRRQLDYPTFAIKPLDSGDRPPITFALADPELGVGVSCDLRQVGDAQDLMTPGQTPQAPSDRVGATTADPRVDLIEHERRRVVSLRQDPLDGERDTRQFTT